MRRAPLRLDGRRSSGNFAEWYKMYRMGGLCRPKCGLVDRLERPILRMLPKAPTSLRDNCAMRKLGTKFGQRLVRNDRE
jgi:hypothetical protein